MVNKRILKQLVLESYTQGTLDEDKVGKIASLLKKDDLKIYIRAIKYTEKKSTIVVDAPFAVDTESKKTIEGVFTNKRIVYNVDPSLLLGMKLTDNDDIYDLSLKTKLNKIETFLEEQYD